MGIFLIVLSLILLVVLVFKNVPIFFASLISSIFCLVTAQLFTGGISVIAGMTSTARLADSTQASSFIFGLANYFGNYFWMFTLGAMFGKLYEVTGAANSIANLIVEKLGAKAAVPAIILVGFILTYGGVSVFVCFFALYPLMLSLFKEADISRRLIPAFYFAGAGTATGWLPGSPQLQNTIPGDALEVGYSAALIPGWIAGIVEMVLVFAWIYWCVAHAKKKGEHFEVTEADQKEIDRLNALGKLPGFLQSILPMIVLLVVLNFTKLGAPVSLFIGVIAAIVIFFNFIEWSKFWDTLKGGLMGGVTSLFNTASVVGFGAVVQNTPAFGTIINVLTGISGSPVVVGSLATAVMAGVCGSGTGGEGIALPIVKEYFVPAMSAKQIQGFARICALSALTLDSLPHCGLVVTVIDYSGNNHKSSYMEAGVTNVVIPIITLIVVLFPLCAMFGYL